MNVQACERTAHVCAFSRFTSTFYGAPCFYRGIEPKRDKIGWFVVSLAEYCIPAARW